MLPLTLKLKLLCYLWPWNLCCYATFNIETYVVMPPLTLFLQSEGIDAPPSAQERLEKVWASLEMPDSQKLDMAIKYSCNEFYLKLEEVGLTLPSWKSWSHIEMLIMLNSKAQLTRKFVQVMFRWFALTVTHNCLKIWIPKEILNLYVIMVIWIWCFGYRWNCLIQGIANC